MQRPKCLSKISRPLEAVHKPSCVITECRLHRQPHQMPNKVSMAFWQIKICFEIFDIHIFVILLPSLTFTTLHNIVPEMTTPKKQNKNSRFRKSNRLVLHYEPRYKNLHPSLEASNAYPCVIKGSKMFLLRAVLVKR